MKKQLFLAFLIFLYSNLVFSAESDVKGLYSNLGFNKIPTISIGGNFELNSGITNQRNEYSQDYLTITSPDNSSDNLVKNKTDDLKFATDAALLLKLKGINDYGFDYGAVLKLNVNFGQNLWGDDNSISKSYVFGEGVFGKFEVGSEIGVSKKMKIDSSSYARAAGGIRGKYLNYINLPSGSMEYAPLFILLPDLPTSHGGYGVGSSNLFFVCDTNGNNAIDTNEVACYNKNGYNNFNYNFQRMENALKISYYTPEIFGFQFGVSYTPDTESRGLGNYWSSKFNTGDLKNVIEYGATFKNSFYDFDFALSATGENAEYQNGKYAINKNVREDLNAYQFGGSVTYFGFTVAGSYGNWDNSLNYKLNSDGLTRPNNNNGTYKTAGLAYEFGPINTSLTYFTSNFQKNKYSAYSLGLDFKLAKGIMPYIEYTNFKFDVNKSEFTNTKDNSGSVILFGLLFNF